MKSEDTVISDITSATKANSKNNKYAKSISATWNGKPITNRDFATEHKKLEQSDMSVYFSPDPSVVSEKLDKHRVAMSKEAINRLHKMATKKYGSVNNMFRTFQKSADEKITLDELSNQLQKRNLDIFVNREDQRLLFELLDKSHTGVMNVKEIVDATNNLSSNPPNTYSKYNTSSSSKTGNPHINEIKANIAAKLAMHRQQAKLVDSARQSDQALRRELRSLDPNSTGYVSKDTFKLALGPQYLDLDVPEEDIDLLLSEYGENKGDQVCISYDGFTRSLGTVNIDPNCIPFFDAKAGLITGLKLRAERLEEATTDPVMIDRIEELSKIVQPLSYNELMQLSMESKEKRKKSSTKFDENDDGKSDFVSTIGRRTIERLQHKTINSTYQPHTRSTPTLPPLSPSLQDRQDAIHSAPQTSSPSLSASQSVSDLSYSYPPSQYEFHTTTTPASKTRLKDPTLVVAEPMATAPLVGVPLGKKIFPERPIDWSRVGVGGDEWRCGPTTMTGMEIQPEERYKTMTDTYFTPVYHYPNDVVERDTISDADSCSIARQDRFERRQRRTRANMAVTAARIELQDLTKQMRMDKRAQRVARATLRYESSLYLSDMEKFEKIPLENMQKRPNFALSSRMWGGNQLQSPDPEEHRDFNTTYTSSFTPESTISGARNDAFGIY